VVRLADNDRTGQPEAFIAQPQALCFVLIVMQTSCTLRACRFHSHLFAHAHNTAHSNTSRQPETADDVASHSSIVSTTITYFNASHMLQATRVTKPEPVNENLAA
jgi:hypothetical protein